MEYTESATTKSLPVADIHVRTEGSDVRVDHSYPVVTPENEKSDFMVTIRASNIKAWRNNLDKLLCNDFPLAEILLALASLGIGAILSALISNVTLATWHGKLFYIVLSPVTAGVSVAYYFVRKIQNISAAAVASSLLDELPKLDIKEKDE